MSEKDLLKTGCENEYEYLDYLLKNRLFPQNGLPQPVFDFASSIVPMINVDLLVRNNKGEILLSWRKDKFSGNVWHIPGGIIRFQEKIEHRIHMVAINELKCDVLWNGKILEINEIISDHQERGHFISLLVECDLTENIAAIQETCNCKLEAGSVAWFERCPDNFIDCQYPIYSKYFLKS